MKSIKHSLWLAALAGGFLFCCAVTREAGAQEGCKSYPGRDRESLCETEAGQQSCVQMLLRHGTMDACYLRGRPDMTVLRTTNENAESDLTRRGCKKLSGNVYQCAEATTAFCHGYRNFFRLTRAPAPAVEGCQLTQGIVIGKPSPPPIPSTTPIKIGKEGNSNTSGGGRPDPLIKIPTPTPSSVVPDTLEGGNLYVYVAGLDGALWTIKKNFGQWGNGQRLGGGGIIGLDACSTNPGKTVVMLRGTGNVLGSAIFDTSAGKNSWINYSVKVGSDPGIACQSGDKLTLFVRGHNNAELYTNYAENGVWANIYQLDGGYPAIEDVAGKAAALKKKDESFWNFAGASFTSGMLGASGLGGGMSGSPDGVAFGNNSRAVFVRGAGDQLYWRVTRDGKPWEQWEALGGKITSDPTAVSRRPGEILVFARGEDNKLWVKRYLNESWSPWFPWGGTVAGNPDAASWGGNRVDVVYRGANGEVYHAWLDDAAFGKEPKIEKIPGVLTNADPTVVAATW